MLIEINHHNGVPIFRQLMEQIKLGILCGVWIPGQEIPSTRSLSEKLAINPMTISKAFSMLEADGWLERRRGLPTVVNPSLSPDKFEHSKLDMLEELLEPVAIRARQMGLSEQAAITTWKHLLASDGKDSITHE